MPWSYSKAFTIGGDGGSPLKWHELILSSVPEPHFHRLGRNIYSLHASGVPSRRPFFIVWDGTFTPCMLPEFRPKGPFSTFGTDLSWLAHVPGNIRLS